MSKTVQFYFDFGSPTAYLAWKKLPEIAARTGATIDHRPFLLGGVFKATGNQSPVMIPAKAAWMNADLTRWAKRHGVPFAFNPAFPINTLGLMRGACAAEAAGCLRAYGDAIYDATWRDGADTGDTEIVRGVLTAAGLDAAALLLASAGEEAKARLKASTEEAVARGAFGAPTFFVDDELFWGQDRLDFVEEALTRAR